MLTVKKSMDLNKEVIDVMGPQHSMSSLHNESFKGAGKIEIEDQTHYIASGGLPPISNKTANRITPQTV